jgi:5-methylcytosine-specific restriction protein A
MPLMPPLHRPRGQRSRREAQRSYDARRGSARDRGYDAEWDKASAAHREAHPFCRYCRFGVFGRKRVEATTCVDHLYPHKGDRRLFWLDLYWIESCADCHDGGKQALERQGAAALHRLADQLGLPRMEAAR